MVDILIWVLGGIIIALVGLLAYFILAVIRPLKRAGGDVILKCIKKRVPLFILDTGKYYLFKAGDKYEKGIALSSEGEFEGYCPPHSLKPNQYGLVVGFGDNERGIIMPSEVIKFINMLKESGRTKEEVNEIINEILKKDYTQEQFEKEFFRKGGKYYNKINPKYRIEVKKLKDYLKQDVELNNKVHLIDIGVVKEFFRWGVSKTLQTLKLRDTAEKVAFYKYDTRQNFQKWLPILMGIGVLALILVIAYVIFAQYTDYSSAMETIAQLKSQLATCQAQVSSGGSVIHG